MKTPKRLEAVKPAQTLTAQPSPAEQPEIFTPKPEDQQVLLALSARCAELQNAFQLASTQMTSKMYQTMALEKLTPGEWFFHADQCVFSRVPKTEEAKAE